MYVLIFDSFCLPFPEWGGGTKQIRIFLQSKRNTRAFKQLNKHQEVCPSKDVSMIQLSPTPPLHMDTQGIFLTLSESNKLESSNSPQLGKLSRQNLQKSKGWIMEQKYVPVLLRWPSQKQTTEYFMMNLRLWYGPFMSRNQRLTIVRLKALM